MKLDKDLRDAIRWYDRLPLRERIANAERMLREGLTIRQVARNIAVQLKETTVRRIAKRVAATLSSAK